MPSKYLEILADVKAKMESVSGIGKVHDYERWNADDAAFIELFAYTPTGGAKQIRGWEISRAGFSEHKAGAFFRHHKFRLRGFMGLKDADATDKTFQTLVEDVSEKFRVAEGPQGATWQYRDGDSPENSPIQGGAIEIRMFGNILCHVTELTLSVTERIVA